MRDSCMRMKNKLAELVYNTIKDLLLTNIKAINVTKINRITLNLKNSTDPLEDFLRLEIFLRKLNYFDLTITLRDCWEIDIEKIISNSRNQIMDFAQENPAGSVGKIFSKCSSDGRKEFEKYLDANLSLCKKILDLSRF